MKFIPTIRDLLPNNLIHCLKPELISESSILHIWRPKIWNSLDESDKKLLDYKWLLLLLLLLTKESYVIVLATDTLKKTNKTHQLLETIEYEHHKCAEKNMLKDEQIINKLYAEYKKIMHWSKIEYSDRI